MTCILFTDKSFADKKLHFGETYICMYSEYLWRWVQSRSNPSIGNLTYVCQIDSFALDLYIYMTEFALSVLVPSRVTNYSVAIAPAFNKSSTAISSDLFVLHTRFLSIGFSRGILFFPGHTISLIIVLFNKAVFFCRSEKYTQTFKNFYIYSGQKLYCLNNFSIDEIRLKGLIFLSSLNSHVWEWW